MRVDVCDVSISFAMEIIFVFILELLNGMHVIKSQEDDGGGGGGGETRSGRATKIRRRRNMTFT